MTATLPPLDVERLVADRRHIHAHPELGYEEFRTAKLVKDRLVKLGYDVRSEVGRTGVVGVRPSEGKGRCVMLRADMDALPISEANDVPYRSTVDGKMHACGHDGHVAIGLAVAERLAELDLPGSVKFAFQPAEEGGNGAAAMIEDRVLADPAVDAAFGIHLWTDLPTGKLGITPGPVFASVDKFEIKITGRGGHAAMPHQAIDPIVVAAHVISALQTIVSRRRNPLEEAVVSVTSVAAGTAFNVIPEDAELKGTVRTFGGDIHKEAPTLVEEVAVGVARGLGAEAHVQYSRSYPPTINDDEMTSFMAEVAAEIVGTDSVVNGARTMGGEDMSFFLEKVPGCYALVGCRNPSKGADYPHHSPHFNIDEDALAIAAELLSRTAVAFLNR